MTKILSTIGPISSDIKKIEFILKKSKILRLNMSHNSPHWHKKNVNLIKKIDPDKYILIDIPGAKPRTLNNNILKIHKGQKVTFAYKIKKNTQYQFLIHFQNYTKRKSNIFLFLMEIFYLNL